MRPHLRALVAAGLTLALIACGDDDTSSGTTVTPTTAADVTTTAPDDLSDRLLTLGDLSSGWETGEDVTAEDLAVVGQVPCPDVAVNEHIVERLTASAGVQFQATGGQYRVMIELLTVGEPEQLAADLDVFFEAMSTCPSDGIEPRNPDVMSVETLALPELGDQRMGYRVMAATSTETDVIWLARGAYVRLGSVTMMLGLTEILDSPTSEPVLSDADFIGVVETAAGKLAP